MIKSDKGTKPNTWRGSLSHNDRVRPVKTCTSQLHEHVGEEQTRHRGRRGDRPSSISQISLQTIFTQQPFFMVGTLYCSISIDIFSISRG